MTSLKAGPVVSQCLGVVEATGAVHRLIRTELELGSGLSHDIVQASIVIGHFCPEEVSIVMRRRKCNHAQTFYSIRLTSQTSQNVNIVRLSWPPRKLKKLLVAKSLN